MSKEATTKQVIKIICDLEYGYPDPITEQTRLLEDMALDSLDVQEVVMECENHYGIAVSDKTIGDAKLKTVGELVELIEKILSEFPSVVKE